MYEEEDLDWSYLYVQELTDFIMCKFELIDSVKGFIDSSMCEEEFDWIIFVRGGVWLIAICTRRSWIDHYLYKLELIDLHLHEQELIESYFY